MPSFDVVSEVNIQEVKNAVDQTQREVGARYDLKDAGITIELKEKEGQILLHAPDKMKLGAAQDIIKQKLSKRGVSLKSVTFEDPQPAGGDTIRQTVVVKQALSEEERKKINKLIKESKLKITSQIQGDQVRVTGKSRDDLQSVMQVLRTTLTDVDLQFTNFRD
jgi:cyclic-di-GMP-binding protein